MPVSEGIALSVQMVLKASYPDSTKLHVLVIYSQNIRNIIVIYSSFDRLLYEIVALKVSHQLFLFI